jgi:hypothetical protein
MMHRPTASQMMGKQWCVSEQESDREQSATGRVQLCADSRRPQR